MLRILFNVVVMLMAFGAYGELIVYDNVETTEMSLIPLQFPSNEAEWEFKQALLVPETSNNITGNLVLIKERPIPQERVIIDFQDKGALGVFIRASNPGRGEYILFSGAEEIKIPVAEIKDDDINFDEFPHNGKIVDADADENDWEELFEKFVVWQISITFLNFFVLGVALLRLHTNASRNGTCFSISIPTVSIWLEISSILCRLVLHAVDPMGYHKVYPFPIVRLAFSLSIAFTISNSLLIGLFWHRILVQSIQVKYVLTITQYIIYTVIFIKFVAILLQGLGDLIKAVPAFRTLASFIEIIMTVVAFIYCFCIMAMSIKIIYQKKERRSVLRKASRVFWRTSALTASLFVLIVYIVVVLLSGTDKPSSYAIVWYTYFMWSTMLDLLQLWLMRPGKNSIKKDLSARTPDSSSIPTACKTKTNSAEKM